MDWDRIMDRIIKRNIRIKVIANPFAGGGQSHREIPGFQKRLEKDFEQLDFSLTNGPGDATRLAKEATANGFQRVIALGGDGTVNEVANGLAGSGAILGVIPTGRCNNFFRMLSLDATRENACRIIAEGEVIQMDTGLIDDFIFVNNAGAGIDALLTEYCHAGKSSLLSVAGMTRAFRAVMNYNHPPITLSIDNLTIKDQFSLISIGIGRYSGNGIKLIPHAVVGDGLFDLCVIKKKGKMELLNDLIHARNGKHINNKDVVLYRGRQLSIASSKPLPFQVDGSSYEMPAKSLTIRINPKSLKVLRDRKYKLSG